MRKVQKRDIRKIIKHYFPGMTMDYLVEMKMEVYKEAMAKKLVEAAKEEGKELSLEDALKEVEFTYEQAREEVIADSLENMLDEPEVLRELAKKEKNLFKRLWQAIMDFFDRLTGKLYKYQHAESRLVGEATREEQKRLNKLFIDALRSANEGAKALNSGKSEGETDGSEASGETKYSIVALEDGKVYVQASRNVINGNTRSEQRKEITDFFSKLLKNEPSL